MADKREERDIKGIYIRYIRSDIKIIFHTLAECLSRDNHCVQTIFLLVTETPNQFALK